MFNAVASPATDLVVRANQLVDAIGARTSLRSRARAPGIFFFDSQKRNRLVMGLYPAAEREPFVVLNDAVSGWHSVFGALETPVGSC